MVEDGPDDDWDVAEGLVGVLVCHELVVVRRVLMRMRVAHCDVVDEYTYSVRMQLTSHVDNQQCRQKQSHGDL